MVAISSMLGDERDTLIRAAPEAERFIRAYVGGAELLNGHQRYCLWIEDEEAALAASVPEIVDRMEKVTASRMRGSTTAQGMADRPHRFLQRAHRPGTSIAVPAITSERREYIPLAFFDSSTVVSNKIYAVYDAEPWLFGLLHSRMHMAWVRAVAGRLESRFNYSTTVVYNTFPVPDLSAAHKADLHKGAISVLAAREQFPDCTLAELYDPDQMPGGLRAAHRELDEIVDRIYRSKPFDSDDERLRLLFEMYEEAIAAEEGAPT